MQIAKDWNTQDDRSGFAGFVTRFAVDSAYLSAFEVHVVGSDEHRELWIPAEELATFNEHIAGEIEVVDAFYGPGFTAEIDPESSLPRDIAEAMGDVQGFVSSYDGSDTSRIRFEWNGKHGDDFRDANILFRRAVLNHVCDNLETAPLSLLRDLYEAETRSSKESWSAAQRLPELAQEFLTRGGPDCVEDYLRGRFRSFDGGMAASSFQVDLELAEALLQAVRERMSTTNDPERVQLLKNGEEIFERWVRARRAL